jgi:hypothetical protein
MEMLPSPPLQRPDNWARLIDTHLAGDMVGFVPEEKATRSIIRYETVIATLVGSLALCVSGYTAYMQRQQVRAAVWPILEFDSSNGPIQFTLANKGVGPAIMRQVIVKVDDQPVRNWQEVLDQLLGPGLHHYSEADMSGHVLAAGESMTVLTPNDDDNNPLAFDKSNPLWVKLNTERLRVSVEICYCSTLGECWTLRAGGSTPASTTETSHCRSSSAVSFQQ